MWNPRARARRGPNGVARARTPTPTAGLGARWDIGGKGDGEKNGRRWSGVYRRVERRRTEGEEIGSRLH